MKDIAFETSTANIGARTARGGAIVFGAMLLQKAFMLVVLAVLARLVTPGDYGLLGMAFALTAFVQVFADLGLPLASIQKRDLTHDQASTLFWLNLALGLLLTGITAAAAPLVGAFYSAPVLRSVTLWSSLGFTIAALGSQQAALLARRMAFGRLAISDILSVIVGGCVGIAMAVRGMGVYALVGQNLAGLSVRTISNWIQSAWIPGRPAHSSGVRDMLRFGGYLTAFNIVNYFSRNLDKILLGSIWGAQAVGFYTRSYALMTYPIIFASGPLATVTVPALSKLQSDPKRMRDAYLQILKVIGLMSFPLMIGLLIAADDVIALVYGRAWQGAVPIFRILCIAGIWQGIYNATGQLFVASGRTDRMFRCGLVMSLFLSATFLIGIRRGAEGVAIAYSVALTVALLPYLKYAYATVGLPLKSVVDALAAPFVASIAMVPFLWATQLAAPVHWGPALRLAVPGAVGALVFFEVLALFGGSFLPDMIRNVVGRLLPRVHRLSEGYAHE